jgi:hypothetical protein
MLIAHPTLPKIYCKELLNISDLIVEAPEKIIKPFFRRHENSFESLPPAIHIRIPGFWKRSTITIMQVILIDIYY